MSNAKNILIVGVGGQGTLLASRLLGNNMLNSGYDVKVSEVHGMSQRGGSVVTYVRYGDEVSSPIIEKGEADLILAFEQLEAARFLPWLKKGGTMIINTQQIDPMPVIMGNAEYPQEILESLRQKNVNVIAVDALSIAENAGNSKAVNVVLIGVMAKSLGFDKEQWLQTVRDNVPAKFVELNEKAFVMGYNAG